MDTVSKIILNELKEIKEQLGELKEDVSQLKEDVVILKADVAGLKADMTAMQIDVRTNRDIKRKHGLARRFKPCFCIGVIFESRHRYR